MEGGGCEGSFLAFAADVEVVATTYNNERGKKNREQRMVERAALGDVLEVDHQGSKEVET